MPSKQPKPKKPNSGNVLKIQFRKWWDNARTQIWGQLVVNWVIYWLALWLHALVPILAALPVVLMSPASSPATPLVCELEVQSVEDISGAKAAYPDCTSFIINVLPPPTTLPIYPTIQELAPEPTVTPIVGANLERCLRLHERIERNTIYEVKVGDNLSCIAFRANITLNLLLENNRQYISNPDMIRDGVPLRIP